MLYLHDSISILFSPYSPSLNKTLHTKKPLCSASLLLIPSSSSSTSQSRAAPASFLTMTKFRFPFPKFKASTAVDAEYLKEIEKARRELRVLIPSRKCASLMLQLAWQEAGTYDAESRAGGPNGSIRTAAELKHDANKGLKTAVEYCEEVKVKCPKVSYADLYQLAGVVAVEVTGGPTIDFVPGRLDSQKSPPGGRLPVPDAGKGALHLREVFNRMGITDDRDIVALTGGRHTLDKAHPGSQGQGTKDPLKFDNSYFVELLKSESEDPSKLPPLVKDTKFRTYVEQYAKDEDAFFTDYANSHKKLSELGFNVKPAADHRIAHGVIGIFIASTVVILGYLFEVNRRSK